MVDNAVTPHAPCRRKRGTGGFAPTLMTAPVTRTGHRATTRASRSPHNGTGRQSSVGVREEGGVGKGCKYTEKQREDERQREKKAERERETDRQTDRQQTDGRTDSETKTERQRQAEKGSVRGTQIERNIDRDTETQTHRQTRQPKMLSNHFALQGVGE